MRPLIHHDGAGPPARPRRLLDGVMLRLRPRLERDLRIARRDAPPLRFRCASTSAYDRATNAFVTEPGTIAWLRSRLREGDVFYDIGANIGIFTLLAAEGVGPRGRVYAFEPHAATIRDLLHNVIANGHQERVDVLSCALHDRVATLPFHYRSLEPATGLSQLGAVEDPFGRQRAPVVSELKAAAPVDDLVADGVLRPATLIKIDVDGNELAVLRGMRRLLESPAGPRSVQVELNPREGQELIGFMEEAGYVLVERHWSKGGQRLLREAADPESVPCNAIFERPAAPLPP